MWKSSSSQELTQGVVSIGTGTSDLKYISSMKSKCINRD